MSYLVFGLCTAARLRFAQFGLVRQTSLLGSRGKWAMSTKGLVHPDKGSTEDAEGVPDAAFLGDGKTARARSAEGSSKAAVGGPEASQQVDAGTKKTKARQATDSIAAVESRSALRVNSWTHITCCPRSTNFV